MNKAGNPRTSASRILSLDALRGFDMLWIMGGGTIFVGLAQLTGWPVLEWWADQQEHTDWHGFHFEDLIFPLFLFIAGVSMPFSILKRKERGDSMGKIYLHLIQRMLLLVVFGMLYNHVHWFRSGEIRYASVLARIALGSFFAALIVLNSKQKWHYIWFAVILLLYWAVMALIPAPGFEAGDFSREGNLAGYIDRLLLPGDLVYENGYMDPEGILSTFPAIATALLGVITGHFLRSGNKKLTPLRKGLLMLLAGVVLIFIGYAWDLVFPINKKLWTSSFIVFAGGWSLVLLSLFYLIIDVLGRKGWAFFFVVIGMNSILSYMMQPVLCTWCIKDFFFTGVISLVPEAGRMFADGLLYTLTCWIILYAFYKKGVFLKV
ncbi:MAG: acyltransferase family protein [Bacteroidota bacterium]